MGIWREGLGLHLLEQRNMKTWVRVRPLEGFGVQRTLSWGYVRVFGRFVYAREMRL